MERLRQEGSALAYRYFKQHSESVGGKVADIILASVVLIDLIAVLVPPPRTHRHRYYGVLAPNSPLRGAVTALVQACSHAAQSAAHGFDPAVAARVGRHQRRVRPATRART